LILLVWDAKKRKKQALAALTEKGDEIIIEMIFV
jgi:hypothetical protein